MWEPGSREQLMVNSNWMRKQREHSSARQNFFQELSVVLPSRSPDRHSLSPSERHEGCLESADSIRLPNTLLLLAQT